MQLCIKHSDRVAWYRKCEGYTPWCAVRRNKKIKHTEQYENYTKQYAKITPVERSENGLQVVKDGTSP